MMEKRNGITNQVTAAIFFVALFLPLIAKTWPRFDVDVVIEEKRELTVQPTLAAQAYKAFPSLYETWFNDHFGYRNLMIKANSLIRYEGFNISASPKVLVGRNGWLYYTGDQMIEDHRGLNHFEPKDLAAWQRVLEDKRDWLASRGIAYLFVLAPNKPSVYPEHLPHGYGRTVGMTPADQLLEHLTRHSRIEVLDLRQTLRDAKPRGQLFQRQDTHWTTMGAYVGYQAIADRVARELPSVSPLTEDEIKKGTYHRHGGDLALMLGLQDWLTEENPQWSIAKPAAARVWEAGGFKDPFATEVPDETLPRALMFRDSFSTALVPFVSEDFRHIRYHWERWHHFTPIEDIIRETRPDIVIEEVVERKITHMDMVTFGLEVPDSLRYSHTVFGFPGDHGGAPEFVPVKHVTLSMDNDGLLVDSIGNDPSFLLPLLETKDRTKLLIHLEFTSPVTSSIQLFYQTEAEAFFDEAKSHRIKTDQGDNMVSIPLANETLNGVIRIDPGSSAGTYVFTRIDIRSN